MEDICKIAGNYFLCETHYAFKYKHGPEYQLINVKTKQILPVNQYGCILVESGEYVVEIPPKEEEKRGIMALFSSKGRKRSTSQTSNSPAQGTSVSSSQNSLNSLNSASNPNSSIRRRSAGNKKEEKGPTRLADLEALIESDNAKSGDDLPVKRNSFTEKMMKESSTQELGINLPTILFSKRIINERKEKVNSKLMLKMLHPPIAQGHIKCALNAIASQTPVSYFVELKEYEILIYTNLTRQHMVKKLPLNKNSLAVTDPNMKEISTFDLMLDAQMYTMEADSHEDMLNWVASVNSASNTLFLVSVLNEQQTREMVRDLLQNGARDKKSSDYVTDTSAIIRDLKAIDFTAVEIKDYHVPELTSDEIQELMNLSDVLRKDSLDVLPDDTLTADTSSNVSRRASKDAPSAATLGRRKSLLVRGKQDPILEGINTTIVINTALQQATNSAPSTPVSISIQNDIKVSDGTLSLNEQEKGVSNTQLEVVPATVAPKFNLNSEDAWLTSPVEASNIQDEIIKMTGMDVQRTNSDVQVVIETAPQTTVNIKYGIDENNKRNRYCIQAAQFDKFVERLSDEFGVPDAFFMDTFILGCRHFSTVPKALEKIMKRFNATLPPNASDNDRAYFRKWRTTIRARIVKFILHWIQDFPFDFKIPENRRTLEKCFTLYELCNFSEIEDVLLEQQLHDSFCEIAALSRFFLIMKINAISQPKLPKPAPPQKKKEFLEFETSEISQQICVVEFEKFSKIRPYELLLQLWGDLKDPNVSGELLNYGEMIQQFNQLSYWVATEIATQPEMKPRIKLIEKFIKIAKELEKLRSYNALVAIVSGLNLAAVSRLKLTWGGVSDKSKEILSELETVVSPQSNYKNYRQIYEKVDREYDGEPFIPFLGKISLI